MHSNWIVQCVFQKNKTKRSLKKVSKCWSWCSVICVSSIKLVYEVTLGLVKVCLVACAVGGVASRQSKVR